MRVRRTGEKRRNRKDGKRYSSRERETVCDCTIQRQQFCEQNHRHVNSRSVSPLSIHTHSTPSVRQDEMLRAFVLIRKLLRNDH